MTTMLRLAKRSEAPYYSSPIYLDNENRKIVFADKTSYASIFAQNNPSCDSIETKGYCVHKTLAEATEYRRALSPTCVVITIDTQGYIYDSYLNLDDKLMLMKTNDMVALNPFGFLSSYNDIASSYAAVLEFSTLADRSEVMTADDKAKAYQLKELAYKVITLFKHTYELSVQTCIELNEDFFDPNPTYAEKTLARLRDISSKLSELLINDHIIGTEQTYSTAVELMTTSSEIGVALTK